MTLRDPLDPRDPPGDRPHWDTCPGVDDCDCAEHEDDGYDDAMERKVDAMRDEEDS